MTDLDVITLVAFVTVVVCVLLAYIWTVLEAHGKL